MRHLKYEHIICTYDNDTLQKKLTDSAAIAEPAEAAMIASAKMIFMMLELM